MKICLTNTSNWRNRPSISQFAVRYQKKRRKCQRWTSLRNWNLLRRNLREIYKRTTKTIFGMPKWQTASPIQSRSCRLSKSDTFLNSAWYDKDSNWHSCSGSRSGHAWFLVWLLSCLATFWPCQPPLTSSILGASLWVYCSIFRDPCILLIFRWAAPW